MEAKNKIKRAYYQPEMVHITIDNEMSLQLDSDPPTRENENTMGAQENPFKANNELLYG